MIQAFATRVILYALIVGACLFYVRGLTARAVNAELKYANLIAEIAQKTAIREAENKLKAEQLEKEYQANLKAHIEQLGAVLNNQDALIKKEKAKHESLQTIIDRLNVERNSLREQVSNLPRLSEGQGDATNSSPGESICDPAAYRTLEQACQITTIDFNACREAFDANCEMTGCE
jgi:hypothetical protein